MSNVELKKLWKRIGDVPIVKGIDLHLNDGEFVVMVGPSGCGKSTILRMLAGLEEVSEGGVFIDDQEITSFPPGSRSVSMVFQDYALYPHMSVYENLAFGLRMQKLSDEEIEKRVAEAARMLGLGDYLQRKPKELSGGQRQRVAMGRAVVKNAKLFLFDEPLSNLDAKLRGVMRGEIKRFHQKNKTTTLYVTHDQLEAMTLADRLVVLNQGVIEQEGHPLEVFDCPKNIFVARFIGSPEINIIDVDVHEEGEDIFIGLAELNICFVLPKEKQEMCRGHKKLKLGLRPSDIYISQDNHLDHWTVEAKVDLVEVLGKNAYITFSYGNEHSCTGEVMGRSLPKMGEMVRVVLNLNHAHFFDWETGTNLLLP